ncbi:hypothetical protein HHK36_002813 [Tetracentron sinense]|uniref:Uncharacterized protein n=1 Tax=Tetracentron sinense TaxID=13715 RepID=A0A834ZX66_TETSI|nr:hypothetical protein HHK36_002813 [Tetracentron sinense]
MASTDLTINLRVDAGMLFSPQKRINLLLYQCFLQLLATPRLTELQHQVIPHLNLFLRVGVSNSGRSTADRQGVGVSNSGRSTANRRGSLPLLRLLLMTLVSTVALVAALALLSWSFGGNSLTEQIEVRVKENWRQDKGYLKYNGYGGHIQAMIPHKTKRGAAALARLNAYEGIPTPYDKMKRMVIPDALKSKKWLGRKIKISTTSSKLDNDSVSCFSYSSIGRHGKLLLWWQMRQKQIVVVVVVEKPVMVVEVNKGRRKVEEGRERVFFFGVRAKERPAAEHGLVGVWKRKIQTLPDP